MTTPVTVIEKSLHEQLTDAWENLKFGGKQRVFNDHMPQASVQYMLSNPNYGDAKKMEWLLECIKKHAKEILDEANAMNQTIESI